MNSIRGQVVFGTALICCSRLLLGCPSEKPGDLERSAKASAAPLSEIAASDLLKSDSGSFVLLALPGMSLEAPSYAAVTGDYVQGTSQSSYPTEWAVTWQRGPLPPAAALQSIVASMATTLEAQKGSPARLADTRAVELGGQPGQQFELTIAGGYSIFVTFAECGGRVVQILVGGVSEVKSTSDKMVRSFRCSPDPSKDLEQVRVVVDARPGWKRTSPTGPPLLEDEHQVVVKPMLVPLPDAATPLETVVPNAVRASGFRLDSPTPTEIKGRKLWRGSVELSQTKHPAAVLAWKCQEGAGVIYVFGKPGASLEEGLDLALTGRCLAPGETPPVYPSKGPR